MTPTPFPFIELLELDIALLKALLRYRRGKKKAKAKLEKLLAGQKAVWQ